MTWGVPELLTMGFSGNVARNFRRNTRVCWGYDVYCWGRGGCSFNTAQGLGLV